MNLTKITLVQQISLDEESRYARLVEHNGMIIINSRPSKLIHPINLGPDGYRNILLF